MTELEKTLLQALRALDTEHEAALHRMNSMQEQIDQLTTSVKYSVKLQKELFTQLGILQSLYRDGSND